MFKGFRIYEIKWANTFAWLLLCLVAPGPVFAQPQISIGEQHRCEYGDVVIPVHASEFFDISALTFSMRIDTLKLEYFAFDNLHPELEGGSFVLSFNEAKGQISISWFRLSPINIHNEILFDLLMYYNEGEAVIVFDDNYEIVYADDSIANDAMLIDGVVLPLDINIINHPQPIDVSEGEPAFFEVGIAENHEFNFRWQQYDGTSWEDLYDTTKFAGADTDRLTINYASVDLDNTSWRCKVYLDHCYVFSDPALLNVTIPSNITELKLNKELLHVFPNPSSHLLNVQIKMDLEHSVLQLLNMQGEVLYVDHNPQPVCTIDVKNLNPGVYLLKIISLGITRETISVIVI